jgi:hypothetical protein
MQLWGLMQQGPLSISKVGGLSMFSKVRFGVFGDAGKDPVS